MPPLRHDGDGSVEGGEAHYALRVDARLPFSSVLIDAYNFAMRLKTLKGFTVFEFISSK